MKVFDDREDYEYFLELLEKASKRVNVEIHAYCLRNSVNRQAPLRDEKWQVETATKYGMLSTLNVRGRPRKDV